MTAPTLTSIYDGIEGFERAISRFCQAPSFQATLNRNSGTFSSALATCRLGAIRMNQILVEGSHCGVTPRGRPLDDETFLLVLIEAGGEIVFRGRREAVAGPETIVLLSARGGFETDQRDRLTSLSVVIPARTLRSCYPTADDWCFRAIDASGGVGGILADHMRACWRMHDGLESGALGDLGACLMQMVGSAFKHSASAPEFNSRSTQIHYLRVQELIAENLEDPHLGPKFVADRLRMSTSYLCKIMRAADTTLGRMILEQRLQRSREFLANPAMAARSVSDIAYSTGFQSLAHLSRRFSERFGKPPTAFRAEARVQDGRAA